MIDYLYALHGIAKWCPDCVADSEIFKSNNPNLHFGLFEKILPAGRQVRALFLLSLAPLLRGKNRHLRLSINI